MDRQAANRCQPVLLRLLAMLLRSRKTPSAPVCPTLSPRVTMLSSMLERDLGSGQSACTAMRIFKLLLAVWTTEWLPSAHHAQEDPTMHYLALSMVESSGGIQCMRKTVETIKLLQDCMRLVFVLDIDTRMRADRQLRFSDAARDLEPWYTEQGESTFNSLQSLRVCCEAGVPPVDMDELVEAVADRVVQEVEGRMGEIVKERGEPKKGMVSFGFKQLN